MSFRALLTDRIGAEVETSLVQMREEDLMPGDVTVAVGWSTINYKDALAVTGAGRIMRRFPLVGGIDLAGTVTASSDAEFSAGDQVLITGWELGQTHHGGFSELARVPGGWLQHIPEPFGPRDAMLIGTAGFTAALSVLALQDAGIGPGQGDVVVTGATGGVGSFAVALLASLGYRVVAATGRSSQSARLQGLGAAQIIHRDELSQPGPGFTSARWIAGVDTVGSHTLANVLAATGTGGVVTCCGLAQGNDLPGSVLPFILRGVSLIGIDSVHASRDRHAAAWELLAGKLDSGVLERIDAGQVGLEGVVAASRRLLAGEVRGRIVVDLSS